MLLKEIIQRVQSLYSKGVQSDDSRLSSRHIYNKLLTIRTRLMSQKSKQKQKISDWNYQTISCVEMIDVDASSCPCITPTGCIVKRSKYRIPKVMTDYNKNLIDYVMTVDSGIKFDPTNKTELIHIRGNKYTATNKRFLIDNGYLYAYGKMIPDVLQIRALFEDPIEVINFSTLCSEDVSCIDIFEIDFPIDSDLIDVLIQFAAEELIVLFKQGVEDKSANTNDDTVQHQ